MNSISFSRLLSALLLPTLGIAQVWTPHRPVDLPQARSGSQLAYDPVRDRVVMFGGWTGSANLGDTWEFDGSRWSQAQPLASPVARHAHLLLWDPASGRTLLFGGFATSERDDTWSWDGVNWTQHANLTVRPSPRFQMGAAYFPPLGRIVTYGGQTGSFTFHSDMWSWNGSAWASMPTPVSSPGRRSQMGFAYDPVRQRLVLVGGHSYPPRAFHNDTWEYDGASWTQGPAAFAVPRSGLVMDYVPAVSKVVVFGGYTDARPLGDCWSYDGTVWQALATPTQLAAREFAGGVTDTVRGRLVLFGGGPRPSLMNDTWTYGDAWVPTFITHGAGCGLAGAVPGLSASIPPWQGELFVVSASVPASASLPLLALGGIASPPVDLGPYGAPGCQLHVNVAGPYSLILLTAQGGQADWSVVIPPGLSGAQFEVQSLMLQPGANALGVAVTPGGSATIR